jgi:cytochrome b6-f complex iron-sulfur subunit
MVEKEEKQTRRGFLLNLGFVTVFLISMAIFFKNMWLYLFPMRKEKTYHKYLVCKEGEIPFGKAKEINLGTIPVFVVNLEGGYRVFSGACTHLGCIVRWQDKEEQFYCPCHKGYFDKTGKVVSGPPPRPLDEYALEKDGNLVFMFIQDKTRGPWA